MWSSHPCWASWKPWERQGCSIWRDVHVCWDMHVYACAGFVPVCSCASLHGQSWCVGMCMHLLCVSGTSLLSVGHARICVWMPAGCACPYCSCLCGMWWGMECSCPRCRSELCMCVGCAWAVCLFLPQVCPLRLPEATLSMVINIFQAPRKSRLVKSSPIPTVLHCA